MRPGLVADAKRVAEAPVDHEQGPIALAFEEGVGGDRGPHLDGVDVRDGRTGSSSHKLADTLDGGIAVVLRIVGEELARDERAVGTSGDDVGERAASVYPELPAGRSAVHRVLPPVSRTRRRGLSTDRRPKWHRGELGQLARLRAARIDAHDMFPAPCGPRMRDIPDLPAYHLHRRHNCRRRSCR